MSHPSSDAQPEPQSPFTVLVRLFAGRIFYGGGDADSEEPEIGLGLGLVLALLALPGGFVSILLFDKYGSFLQWLRGQNHFDPYAAAMPDEYFFIALSMAVTGAVVVWKWDSILPGRRDYMNLVPLPIPATHIFLANLAALGLLTATLALDVNAASGILFPAVVTASHSNFSFFTHFAVAHIVSVVSASIFTFLALLSFLGLLMAALPRQLFRRIAPYLRALVLVGLLALMLSTFAVAALLHPLSSLMSSAARFLPSVWFLGVFMSLLSGAPAPAHWLARSAFTAMAAALLLGSIAYAASYHRYFIRIPETTETLPARGRPGLSWLGALADRWILRSPFQRGCFRFVWKTLMRSERHILALASFAGLGLILSSQALLHAFEGNRTVRAALLSSDALSVPLILAFCVITGLRMAFEIPVELRSNWIFKLLLDAGNHECGVVARQIMLTLVLPGLLLVLLPAYIYFVGWSVGLMHTALVTAWCLLLTETLLLRFRKLPFTCPLPSFRQHVVVEVVVAVMAFLLFAITTSEVEARNLVYAPAMLVFVPPAVVVWYLIRRLRAETVEVERQLIFEDAPEHALELLQLSDIA